MIQHELPHTQLVEFLRAQVNADGNKSTAVLIIALTRTDRLAAISGAVPSQIIRQHVSQRLDDILRNADRFAHLDGERVLLVLPSLANKDHSVLAAIKIISELKKPFPVASHTVALRPCIGIASFPETSRNANQLLLHADSALDAAMTDEHGFSIYRSDGIDENTTQQDIEIELDKAIRANELQVNYQPKVDIQTGRCLSAEALVRWTAPWGQAVNPGLLIDHAENSGLINPLTVWILNTALRHVAAFAKAGTNISVSVNLPSKMLEEEELPQMVQQALDIWNISPARLTLEITEKSMMHDMEASIVMLTRLRELGIRLSIDDFGTGYSALAYLKRLPVHELKIDILFIRNIHLSLGDKQLVRAIIDLAHNFDLVTVAEGIEDQKTFDLLREMGCDIAQGFLFSKALPESEFIQWHRQLVMAN